MCLFQNVKVFRISHIPIYQQKHLINTIQAFISCDIKVINVKLNNFIVIYN